MRLELNAERDARTRESPRMVTPPKADECTQELSRSTEALSMHMPVKHFETTSQFSKVTLPGRGRRRRRKKMGKMRMIRMRNNAKEKKEQAKKDGV